MSQKRSAEEALPDVRYPRIRLASPSPGRTSESDTESIHSNQGYKTESVKDTSDTFSPPPSHLYNIEYEVTDFEENKFNYYLSEDSDGNDFDILGSVVGNDLYSESFDDALLGDTSEENSTSPTSNSDVDPGLPRNDYLDFEKCLLCETDKKDISYPYCSTCFGWKKNFFPSRPKRRKKNFKKSRNILVESKEGNENCESEVSDKKENLSDRLCEDSGVGSSEAQQSEDTVDGPSTSNYTNSTNPCNLSSDKMCKVCFAKLECGLFVHSSIAHLYGCYSCANKIWYRNGKCPICRRKVFKVIKLL